MSVYVVTKKHTPEHLDGTTAVLTTILGVYSSLRVARALADHNNRHNRPDHRTQFNFEEWGVEDSWELGDWSCK